MKDDLKLILKHIMRFFLKLFWLCPIKKNKIFFMANMGKGFLCNPKYIYQSIVSDERFRDCELIWCFIAPEKQDASLFSSNTKLIRKGNICKYFYHLLTSKIIIYNCGGFSYAPIRKKQFLVETWHGGGAFKRVGLTVPNKSKSSKKGISMASKAIDLFLSSSGIASEYMLRQSMDYHGEILQSGFPRNDILFAPKKDKVIEIKRSLGIEPETNIILYAPTFKGNEDSAINVDTTYELIQPEKVKESFVKKFGGKWVFLCRGHQYANEISIQGSDGDVSSYPDMQELLMSTDVLITDYSSSIWDFAILKRPAFLFVPDLEQYEKNERGFLIPIERWPGIVAGSNDELSEKIMEFSSDEYLRKLEEFEKYASSYERGHACEMVKEALLSKIAR